MTLIEGLIHFVVDIETSTVCAHTEQQSCGQGPHLRLQYQQFALRVRSRSRESLRSRYRMSQQVTNLLIA